MVAQVGLASNVSDFRQCRRAFGQLWPDLAPIWAISAESGLISGVIRPHIGAKTLDLDEDWCHQRESSRGRLFERPALARGTPHIGFLCEIRAGVRPIPSLDRGYGEDNDHNRWGRRCCAFLH